MGNDRYALRRWIPEFRSSAIENEFRWARRDTDRASSLLYLAMAGLIFVAYHWVDRRNFVGSDGGEIEVLLMLRLLPAIVVGIVAVVFRRTTQPKVVSAGIAVAAIAISGTYLAIGWYTQSHGAESVLNVFFPFVCFFFVLMSPSSFRAGVALALLVTLVAVPGAVIIGVTDAAMQRMAVLLGLATIGALIILTVVQRNHRRLYARLRRAEDLRRRVAQKLSEAERIGSVDLLVANVAHDLNNFLTPVVGFTEMLQADLEDDNPRQALAQQACEAAVRARELVLRLLDDARSQPASIRVCLRDSVETLHETLQDAVRGSTLDLKLPDADIHVLAAPQAFERVLLNLVVNAGDAVAEEDGVVKVRFEKIIEARDSTPCVRMRVCDNGEGIGPAVRERLFDPHITTKAAGHGLGLTSVKQIVEDHDGNVDARNLEQGAVFEVTWPLAPDASGETT